MKVTVKTVRQNDEVARIVYFTINESKEEFVLTPRFSYLPLIKAGEKLHIEVADPLNFGTDKDENMNRLVVTKIDRGA